MTDIPSGESEKDQRKRAEVMQSMIDQFNGGSVFSLSSQHSKVTRQDRLQDRYLKIFRLKKLIIVTVT